MVWPNRTGSNHNLHSSAYCFCENAVHIFASGPNTTFTCNCQEPKSNILVSIKGKTEFPEFWVRSFGASEVVHMNYKKVWEAQIFALFTDYPFCTELRACRAGLLRQEARPVPPAAAEGHPQSWGPFFLFATSSFVSKALTPLSGHYYLEAHLHQKINQGIRPILPFLPCPHVRSLHLHLYSCPANRFICTIFLDSTYLH